MSQTKTPTGVWDIKLDLIQEQQSTLEIQPKISLQQEDNTTKIVIEETTKEPIKISHTTPGRQDIEVIVKNGVSATIIEKVSDNVITNVSFYICEGSTLNYARIQEGTYKGENTAKVCGTLNYYEINKGTTHNTMKTVIEENATFTSTNILLGLKGDKIHITPNVLHKKGSTSILNAKAILQEALGIYDGIVHIPIDAPKSIAHQRIDALLLTKTSEMKESPQLYIDNKDVECSHAATSTHTNQEQEFYLQTRGLTRAQAQMITIQATIFEAIQQLPENFQKEILDDTKQLIKRYVQEQEQQS